MELRPYQEKLISDIRHQFTLGHKRVLAVSPTGSGKTATTAAMIKRTVARYRTAMFSVHRQELMDQSIEAFKEQGIEHGCIAAGYDGDPDQPVQIASIDSLRRRLEKITFKPYLFVIDEASHSCSETWKYVINRYPDAYTIGITATPERLDGKGLGEIYTSMVQGPTTAWLIEHGYLSPYELYGPKMPDMSGCRTRFGDFAPEQAANIMDTPKITGDAIREYRKYSDNKRAVAFCVSIEHSKHTAEAFNNAGYNAFHIDGNTPRIIRKKAVDDFRSGNIKVLTSVDIFSEGFDLPAVECAILLRPTQSLSMYLQQVGRALRKSPGKEKAIILDHAGNVQRHYLPDEDREWSLSGSKKQKSSEQEASLKIRQCMKCYHFHRPAPVCPRCGNVYEIVSREIEVVEGDLTKFERKKINKKQTDKDQYEAKTRDQLETLALSRKHKNPTVWAEIILAAREKRKPNYAIAMSRRKLYM